MNPEFPAHRLYPKVETLMNPEISTPLDARILIFVGRARDRLNDIRLLCTRRAYTSALISMEALEAETNNIAAESRAAIKADLELTPTEKGDSDATDNL